MKVGQCVKYCHEYDHADHDQWSIGVVTKVYENGRFHVVWTDCRFPDEAFDGPLAAPRTLFDELDMAENDGPIFLL